MNRQKDFKEKAITSAEAAAKVLSNQTAILGALVAVGILKAPAP